MYPHGATLNVQKPAVPLLSSGTCFLTQYIHADVAKDDRYLYTGKIAYPMHRPLMALWHQPGEGHLIVCGSVGMFEDQFVDKEGNPKILDFLVKWSAPDSSVRVRAKPPADLPTSMKQCEHFNSVCCSSLAIAQSIRC